MLPGQPAVDLCLLKVFLAGLFPFISSLDVNDAPPRNKPACLITDGDAI